MPKISLIEWQRRYGTEKACAATLAKYRWPQGFICPKCGHDSSWYITTRKVYQCSRCQHQVSVTAGTLFHSTNLPLVKWFWAIYLMASDKGGISALRLSKHIGVSWPTARNMLKKIRTAMAHRDSIYRLFDELIELDDTYVGGNKPGKSGRGAKGKKPIRARCTERAYTSLANASVHQPVGCLGISARNNATNAVDPMVPCGYGPNTPTRS